MKIYMASSWKNEKVVKAVTNILRETGFDVDNFTDNANGRFVFHYLEIGEIHTLNAISFLKDERAQKAFQEDKKWLDWADVVVLVLPAGRSAHLEAGYIKGQGKHLVILSPYGFPSGEFDVMYGFADLLTTQTSEVMAFLANVSVEEEKKSES